MINFKKLDSLVERYQELNQIVSIFEESKEWLEKTKELAEITPIYNNYNDYKKTLKNIEITREIINNEEDSELINLAEEELIMLEKQKDDLEKKLILFLTEKDPNDDKDVVVEIRAGAGGDEAALFANNLMKMYKAYADKKHFIVEDIDISYTELGGVKEAIFSISGKNVYSDLKFESGVHRVQRVPTTETQGRIHTSTVTVAVLPEIEDVKIEINEKDLKIDTYRSGGAGGQHVNKTESAIRITHLPTGIIAQCQDEKSQIKNREKAMKVLKARIYDYYQTKQKKELASNRKMQVGTGDRSERIRTYNFPQGRVTDHRINFTLYKLDEFLSGDIEEMINALKIENNKLINGF